MNLSVKPVLTTVAFLFSEKYTTLLIIYNCCLNPRPAFLPDPNDGSLYTLGGKNNEGLTVSIYFLTILEKCPNQALVNTKGTPQGNFLCSSQYCKGFLLFKGSASVSWKSSVRLAKNQGLPPPLEDVVIGFSKQTKMLNLFKIITNLCTPQIRANI